ncbi:MAG: dihydroxy-acid dehydratase [Rhodospirillales bacterium]|nr:dihydroxy-acid dehydratase [Rhodospirillales bacterium]
MNKKLRSNFPYGSSPWAVRRAQWKALGLSNEDLEKPKIAIVNTSSELAICFSHLDGIAAKLKTTIREAGAVPFEVRTAAPSDFITSAGRRGGYILSARDLIVNDIEVAVEGAQLDGMICLASCDKTVPGQLMAAARLDIPAIIAICGYQPSGEFEGKHVDIEDVFLMAGHVLAGKMTAEKLEGMADNAIGGPGVCSGMGTANSMHIACEALGMAMPGSAPVAANSDKMFTDIEAAGKRIVEMVADGQTPRDILTPDAFANAAMAVLGVSGSINCVKHLQAIAIEAECDIDVYALFDELSAEIPVLAAVRPNGEGTIEAFESAGGARTVMKRMEKYIRGGAITVTGKTVAENLAEITPGEDQVIRDADNPFSNRPPIVIVKGSLAEEGAIIKLGLLEDRVFEFTGPAHVFGLADDAMEAVRGGHIKEGEVVVLRGLGVKGGPGMSTASRVVFALDGAGLGDTCALVTDGQLSGLVNRGLVVGEVSPEAATGGALGLVEDGDIIAIDAISKSVELQVSKTELDARRARLKNEPLDEGKPGWLSIYRDTVQPLAKGAVLAKREF